jgi:hypothetical protein
LVCWSIVAGLSAGNHIFERSQLNNLISIITAILM